VLQRGISEGVYPESTPGTRVGDELDAIRSLGRYIDDKPWLQCPAFRETFGREGRRDAYHMPDWTPAQWERAKQFFLTAPSPGNESARTYGAPVIWDAEPVHRGCRSVAFRDGVVGRGIPEDLFQRLRRESEAFVRKTEAAPETE
jgi:hypothetical protein